MGRLRPGEVDRTGMSPWRRSVSRRIAALPAVGKALAAVLLVAGLLGAGLFVVLRPVSAGTDALQAVYDDTKVPEKPPIPQTTFVYDRNGTLIAVLHGGVNRTPVALRRIPVTLRNAVIAAEDADFYTE